MEELHEKLRGILSWLPDLKKLNNQAGWKYQYKK